MIRDALIGTVVAVVLMPAPAAADQPAPPALDGIGVDDRVGEQIPQDVELTDSEGRKLRLAEMFDAGEPVVMVLAYTRCDSLCSLLLRGVADAVRRAELKLGADYRIVTVSIDPRETVADAAAKQKALLESAGYDPTDAGWSFLIAEETEIRRLADALGFVYRWDERSEQFAHPGVIFVLSPEGQLSGNLYGVQFADGDLEEAVQIAAAGETAGADDGGGILSCFLFDPALRKYWGTISTLFKVGAAGVFLALLGGVVILFRKERARR